MAQQLMYQELAPFYDHIYRWKDYQKEAELVASLVQKYEKQEAHTLLDVGCGTGKHLKYLKEYFSCTGTDLNKEMIAIAKKAVPDVPFKVADMIDFNFHKRFDVITSLFSAIGCVKTYANVQKTFHTFANHLTPGGILILEPWHTKQSYQTGLLHLNTYQTEDLMIAQMNVSKQKALRSDDAIASIIEMHYLVGRKGHGIKHVIDYDIEGLFDIPRMLRLLENAGFTSTFLPKGFGVDDVGNDRGLFVGRKL